MNPSYTFKGKCDVCEGQPVLRELGMCAVCTFGEADSTWEWLFDDVVKAEPKATKKYLNKQLAEWAKAGLIDKEGQINSIVASTLQLNQSIMDQIEALI